MDIQLQRVHKWFGPVHANDDVNVTFVGGRIVGILGENGAGKSTLMKILSGFQPVSSGDILIDGKKVEYRGPQAAIAHGVGMLQQDPLDVPAFTVIENFRFGSPFSHKEALKRLNDISVRCVFDLPPQTPISQLSIAQRQQLEIVRLLALGVRVLILDEPTTGISAEQKDALFETLKALAREGLTVLLVSHKLEDVIALCDEVVVLRGGKLVGDKQMPATTKELVALMFGQELAPQVRERVPLGDPVLTLDGVTFHDQRLHVQNLTLKLRAGEVVGLAGLDGSGQELAMRAAVGLTRIDHGHVRVRDVDLTNRGYRKFLAHGVIFGAAGRLEEGLVAGLTLTEHVALVNETESIVDWKRAETLTSQQIKHYDVRGRASDQIQQLSGGNQQRVLMALMPAQPAALVLEQPTRGLDVDSARWIWEQLLARRAGGTTILFSSADLDELVAYSDRILVFYSGHVYEIADAAATTIDELGRLIGGDFQRAH